MDQLFLDIKAQLEAEVPELQYIAMYNGQFDQMTENGAMVESFNTPFVLIEFDDDQQFLQLGAGYQIIDPLYVTIHIGDVLYDAQDGTMEQNLTIFPLKQKIYKALNLHEFNRACAFVRVSETQDKSHTNLYHYKQRYQTSLIDNNLKQPVNGITKDPPTDLEIDTQYDPPPFLKGT